VPVLVDLEATGGDVEQVGVGDATRRDEQPLDLDDVARAVRVDEVRTQSA
jgi:hypothetical protein